MENKNHVFIISQIGDQGTEARKWADIVADSIVEPVVNELGLQILRSDRDPTPGPITPQILNSILSARAVIADLTGRNPNVYYELCFAHSFEKPVVLLVDDPSSLPFDVKSERVITLANNEGTIDLPTGDAAKKDLREALDVVLAEGYEPRSIINEVANVRSIDNMAPSDPMATEISALSRRVEQIYEQVASPQGGQDSPYKVADVKQLTKLVKKLAIEQRPVNREDIAELWSNKISPAFDEWVNERLQEFPEFNEQDFDDIPF